jgi:hypothetical protein
LDGADITCRGVREPQLQIEIQNQIKTVSMISMKQAENISSSFSLGNFQANVDKQNGSHVLLQ